MNASARVVVVAAATGTAASNCGAHLQCTSHSNLYSILRLWHECIPESLSHTQFVRLSLSKSTPRPQVAFLPPHKLPLPTPALIIMIKKVLLCLAALAVASTTPSVEAEPQVAGAVVLGGISIATAVIPLIGGLFKKKECRQVACWVATGTCYRDVAAKVQNEIFKGRDGYSIESSGANGAWVRYWRVRTGVSKDQIIASGKCDNGKRFEVTNCQTTGKVHC